MPQLPSLRAAVALLIVIVAAAILLAAFKIVPVAIAALAGPPLALLGSGDWRIFSWSATVS